MCQIFLFWGDENVLELDRGMSIWYCEYTKKPLNCAFQKGKFYDMWSLNLKKDQAMLADIKQEWYFYVH